MSKWYNKVEGATVRIEAYKTPIDFTRPDIKPIQQQGIGTGFFVPTRPNTDNWYAILTCAHVIDSCHMDQISIIFPKVGKKRFRTARIQSLCPEYDIAIIAMKIDDKYIRDAVSPLPLGGGHIASGTPVSAYGYPLGQWSMKYTEGNFSGFSDGRLQHDSAISPGNSGGALINSLTGEVIGVNSATIVGGGATGVHFAVPIDLYKRLSWNLLGGAMRVIHPPKLGFCYHETTESMIAYKLNKLKGGGKELVGGVNIHHLFENSPLRKYGMREGAILTKIRWELSPGTTYSKWYNIDRFGELLVEWNGRQRVAVEHCLARVPLGSKINIEFVQDDKIQHIVTTPTNIQTGSFTNVSPPFERMPEYVMWAGICVMNLVMNHAIHMPQTFLQMKPKDREAQTLVVTAILPGYESVPLMVGSTICCVNGHGSKEKPLRTIKEYRAALKKTINGYLSISDMMGRTYVLDVATVLRQETTFRDRGVYLPDKEVLTSYL